MDTNSMNPTNQIDVERSAQVFVFGDQTTPFENTLHRLLHFKNDGILSDFFDKVAFHLRRYLGNLPATQQHWFPSFTTLIDLVAQHGSFNGAPALKFALLCVTQIAQFIRYLGTGSRPYPSATTTYLVGACTGAFAAAAISTSQTLAELIPVAVETVLVAFRCALHSLILRNELEPLVSEAQQSWTAIVGTLKPEVVELIKAFNSNKGLPTVSQLYISSIGRNNTSVSGPPRLLSEFLSSSSLRYSFVPIDLPYHAPHIFRLEDAAYVVGRFHDSTVDEYRQRLNVVSVVSGQIISTPNFRELISGAVSEALSQPMNWDLMATSLAGEIERRKFTSCTIYQVSSQSGPLLSSALRKNATLEVGVLNILEEDTASDPLANNTGKFSQSGIAILGYSGRFPESTSNEEFWELLMAGRDVHREIPKDRFDWKAHYDPSGKTKNTSRIKYGCFIKEPGLFDARFFNMSPRECENCDPAQRLAIMSAYEALEMAGLVPNASPSTQQDRIGVFYGVTSDDWREVNSGQNIDTYFIPGGNRAFIPGRISYFFRFCGPSLSIDTACSSSFAAIQTACSYLWRGECDTALAGGANILTNPDNFAGLDRGHFLSTTGNCNAFDDDANGYCRSDAVGTVVLKRLEDAISDHDPIVGVIRGAYTNHCGRTDSITRPFEGDQAAVFNRIMRYADIDPRDVGYVEMHGTGTQAGDATEMKSVLSIFAPDPQRKLPLYLGTAKANIGHAESASGVSSLIKVLMMMKNNAIPPHCGIKTKINQSYPRNMKERNIHIAMEPTVWNAHDAPHAKRKAFLNNFSAAGGNTAMLLEDAPLNSHSRLSGANDPRSRHPVTVTAKTIKSLQGTIDALISHLERNPDLSVSSLSYTTTARRIHHHFRVLVSGSDIPSIQTRLRDSLLRILDQKLVPSSKNRPKIIIVFTGQGALYKGIGKQLFETLPSFRESILRLNGIAEQQGFPSFLPLVDGSIEKVEDASPVMNHLALVCVQIALFGFWKSLGLVPAATIGHSLGEYPALYASGVLTAADAVYLVGTRAQLLSEKATAGTHAMLAVKLPVDRIKPELSGTSCEVACLNQPSSNVISGPSEELVALGNKLRSRGVECISLEIPFAFHSSQVDPLLEPFKKAAGNISYKPPTIPYISSLLGKVIPEGDTETLTASYLTKTCRSPVNFHGAVDAAKSDGMANETSFWVEIGSHPACSGMIKGILGRDTVTIASMRKNTDSWTVLTSGLESLYANGVDINWTEYHRGFEDFQEVLSLPRYYWDLKNYWIAYRNNFCLTKGDELSAHLEVAVSEQNKFRYLSPSVQKILEQDDDTKISTILTESDIHDERLAPIFTGHSVNNVSLCPSSLYADIALTITHHLMNSVNIESEKAGFDISDMKVQNPMVSRTDSEPQLFHVSASAEWRNNFVSFKLFTVNDEGKKITDCATFVVRITPKHTWIDEWKRSAHLVQSRIRALASCAENGNAHRLKRRLVYQMFSAIVDYSQDYQGMQEVILDSEDHEATARVTFQVGDNGFTFNPCWVDSLGHIAGFIMNGSDATPSKTQLFINHGWEHMRCAVKFAKGKHYQTYNRMQLETGTTYVGDTYIFEDQNLVAIFEGVRFQGVPRQLLERLLPPSGRLNRVGNMTAVRKQDPPPPRPKATPMGLVQNLPKTQVIKIIPKAPPKTIINEVAAHMMEIICTEAGVDPSELGPNEEFANHGIDSLLSLTICGKIQEELGADVPASLFADYPTPNLLIGFFGATDAPSISTSTSSSSSEIGSGIGSTDNCGSGCDTGSNSDQEIKPSVLEFIRETMAKETGVAICELTPTANFIDMGVDSLLALTIVGALSETLEIELPSTLFMENQNLEEVGKVLGIQKTTKAPPSRSKAAFSQISDCDPHSSPQSTSILLWGNPKTAKKTLFLFPDGSGSGTSYASLPKLVANTAAYALNCPWMKTPQNMTCSLEELTSKYVIEIRRRQPSGPYYLGGWSAGGICAYEAAQQLARDGQKTERLILIDSPNPIGLENPPQRMYDFFESCGIFGTNGKAPPSWLRPHFDAFIRLLDKYDIQPFIAKTGVRTHILYARDGICKHPDSPRPEIRPDDPREMLWLINNRTDFTAGGWASLIGSHNLHVDVISDVNHFSMMDKGPHMDTFENFLSRAMV